MHESGKFKHNDELANAGDAKQDRGVNEPLQARAWLEHARKYSRSKVARLENRSKIFGSKMARLENRSKIFRSKMARLEKCSNSSQIKKMKTEFSPTLLPLCDCCMYILLRAYVFVDL